MTERAERQLDLQRVIDAAPGSFLVLAPDPPHFTVLAATDAYLHATHNARGDIIGRPVLELYPASPDDPATAAASALLASFQRVLHAGVPDLLGIHKFEVRRPESRGGDFEERFWEVANFPLLRARSKTT
jgi:hypothetical protein